MNFVSTKPENFQYCNYSYEFISGVGLREQGWSSAMIEKFLRKPDKVETDHGALYRVRRVLRTMRSPAFIESLWPGLTKPEIDRAMAAAHYKLCRHRYKLRKQRQ
jgi:hypothetical protein